MKEKTCIGCRAAGFLWKCVKKLLLVGVLLFAGTFTIYLFNLENKLIYHGVYPFLQKHYNAQKRDRRL